MKLPASKTGIARYIACGLLWKAQEETARPNSVQTLLCLSLTEELQG